ncbi:MAG: hypothetical protein P9M12_02090 [Candidatus Aceula lacicola]|nr:hypothetical protein [Candidatus Aceula lacicola]
MLDLKKIIQDLQNIDLKNMNLNVDFKKINIQLLQKNLLKRKDILYNIAIILVALFIVQGTFSYRQQASQDIDLEIKQLEEKSFAIKSYENQEKILKNIMETSQKGYSSATSIINVISKIAQSFDVKIISFVPSKLQNFSDYTEQAIKFTFSGSFEDMLRFVYKIEHYEKSFRIDSWNKTKSFTNTLNPDEQDDEIISWKMMLTSIDLKQ